MDKDPEPLTVAKLMEMVNGLCPKRFIVCHAKNELAVKHALKELDTFRVEVVVSQFVEPGQVFVINPRQLIVG